MPTRNVDFAQVDDVPNWKNTSPRLGASYDLFGNGKTAVKASIGRYMEAPNLTTITAGHGSRRPPSSTPRRGRGATPTATSCRRPASSGAISNVNFGNSVHHTRRTADDVRTTRGFNWEGSASVQHELLPQRLGQCRRTSAAGSAISP